MRKLTILLLTLTFAFTSATYAQRRTVQNKPYIDYRKFHYGFLFGVHSQGISFENNGYIEPTTGEQWYAEDSRMNIGFTVGVLGEWRLNQYFALRATPSLHFGQKSIVFREQATKRETTQTMKSTYISVPVDIKFAAPRFNNYRPYLLAGVNPMYNLTRQKQENILTKPFDIYLEFGLGCDFYLPYFKLIPELKFCIGLLDILDKDRRALRDKNKLVYTQSVNKSKADMIILTFYFE